MGASLIRALVLVVAGGVLGFAVNAARPGGVSLQAFAPPTQCSGAEAAVAAPVEMSPTDASALCGRPDVVIADTRSAAAYAEGHVAGAVHLPCDANGHAAVEALAHFDRAQTIIVYGDSSDSARPVAESLAQRHPGVRVAVLTGGFGAWSSAGLACASGPCDDCKAASVAGEHR